MISSIGKRWKNIANSNILSGKIISISASTQLIYSLVVFSKTTMLAVYKDSKKFPFLILLNSFN